MIEMSLDKETVLFPDRAAGMPVKASPALFPASAGQSEQPKAVGDATEKKTRPLRPKNGVQLQPQAPPLGPPPPQRKRRYTVSGPGQKGGANKRRRRVNSIGYSAEPVLPSHFMLGGNIFDPLNLNSLLDDEVNRLTNLDTPRCSPLPLRGGDPVEILQPRDISDPLNLSQSGEPFAQGGWMKGGACRSRRRHRNRGGMANKEATAASVFAVPHASRDGSSDPCSPLSCELNTSINCREDVVQPTLPRRHTHPPTSSLGHGRQNHGDQRPNQRRRRRTTSLRSQVGHAPCDTPLTTRAPPPPARFQTPLVGGAKYRCGGVQQESSQTPTKKTKDRGRYAQGNHSRYYGFHGWYGDAREQGGHVGAGPPDPRLRLLKAHWFKDKRVLDIGCGAGHMTLGVARAFGPALITGVELDERLVRAANQNVRHFLSHDLARDSRVTKGFPLCFRVGRGPLAAPPLHLPGNQSDGFPGNVCFIMGDYVSEQKAWPGQGQYDVIMCLGVTKWVQLQSGDAGVVRLFERAYQSLSPGGMFFLEAQPWSSYARSKNLTATTRRNYRSVRLKPDTFSCYLIRSVGYTSYTLLHTGEQQPGNQRPANQRPRNRRPRNQRAIYIFHKGPASRK